MITASFGHYKGVRISVSLALRFSELAIDTCLIDYVNFPFCYFEKLELFKDCT